MPYYELYYDNQNLIIRFYLNPFEKFTENVKGPSIFLYKKSTIELNDVLPSDMDSTSIVKKYGIPEGTLNINELIIDYSFTNGKYFSLLSFYLNRNGTINKIWINFGKYP